MLQLHLVKSNTASESFIHHGGLLFTRALDWEQDDEFQEGVECEVGRLLGCLAISQELLFFFLLQSLVRHH